MIDLMFYLYVGDNIELFLLLFNTSWKTLYVKNDQNDEFEYETNKKQNRNRRINEEKLNGLILINEEKLEK